jgi:hypothetical protein
MNYSRNLEIGQLVKPIQINQEFQKLLNPGGPKYFQLNSSEMSLMAYLGII